MLKLKFSFFNPLLLIHSPLYSINGDDKANYKKMTLIINIIASVLLILVYPIAATSSAMSIASPSATLLFKLFCYLVLAYPVFCIVGWLGVYFQKPILSYFPVYHIAFTVLFYFVVDWLTK